MRNFNILSLPALCLLIATYFNMACSPKAGTTSQRTDESAASSAKEASAKSRIIFIAGACSHGPGEHEHHAGCQLLASELNKNMGSQVEATVYQGWPADTTVLDQAKSIVMYMDGENGHLALQHMEHLGALMQKGVGLTCLHYAVEPGNNKGWPEFLDWLGGYFEINYSVNPHWDAEFTRLPQHPVTSGVKPFTVNDEWYYNMRFRNNMQGVTPILTAIPPASTLSRPNGSHEGNEQVRKMLGQPQHTAWVTERANQGRSFGFTGGHYHKSWGNKNFRRLVLNAIVWTANIPVPAGGVPLSDLSESALQANLDPKPCR